MTQIIYALIDTDGDIVCAFLDIITAEREAKETGCDYTTINLYS